MATKSTCEANCKFFKIYLLAQSTLMYGQELAVLLASPSMFGTFSVLLGGSVEF